MKKYINAVNYNIKYIFWFEFCFKLITVLIGLPLFKVFVNFIKSTYNLKFLSIYSLGTLFSHVSFYFIVFGIILLASLYFIFDYSVILLLIHCGLDKNKVSYKNTIFKALKKTLCVFKPRNLLYLLLPCIFMLFINLGLIIIACNYTDYFKLLINFITTNLFSSIIFIVVLIVLLYIFIRCLFSFNDYIIDDISFIQSFKKFKYVNNFKTFIILLIRKVLSFVIVMILVNLIPYLFFVLRDEISDMIFTSLISGLFITVFIYLLFYYHIKSTVNDILYISCKNYYYKNEKVSIVSDINPINKYLKFIRYGALLIVVIFFTIIMYKVNDKQIKYDFIFDYHIDITAHRGASAHAPENTIAAFQKAYDIGVDYIELDVHESKDGYVYVMHDGSLNRTLRVNKLDYKVTWDEIKNLNVVSDFKEYTNEKVPLLEDVLKWAKDKKVLLNIELKPSSKSVHLEDTVVELLHKYNYVDKCVVASFDINAIRKVKMLDNKINIVYLGNDLRYVDDVNIYSVYYPSITRDMVKMLHKNNQKIYAWTVDDEDIVKSLINMGVDNIISNDPEIVKNVVKNYKNRNKTNALINFLLYLYK